MAVKVETFIRVWQHAVSLEEVVRKTGLGGPRSASSKASELRARGVPLKHFRRRKGEDNAELLTAIAVEAAAEALEAQPPALRAYMAKDFELPEPKKRR